MKYIYKIICLPFLYNQIVPPEHASTPVKPKAEGLGKALYDFVAQTSIELTVRKVCVFYYLCLFLFKFLKYALLCIHFILLT